VKALYSDKKFHPLLMRWKKTVDDYGYHSYIKVINAADMDVPQGRERVFMVSVRNDVIEEVFHGKDYRFPADMPRKRKIEDFLLPPEQVPEEYYLKAAHLPKFLNLLTHAGDDFDNNLTDAQKAAITSANVSLTTDQPEDIPQDTSVNNATKYALVEFMDRLLGLQFIDRAEKLIAAESVVAPAEIVALADKRSAAKAAKDWATADALRAEIDAAGWVLTDTPTGPKLTKKV
jgi:site-specific DNA-cytosine methylase